MIGESPNSGIDGTLTFGQVRMKHNRKVYAMKLLSKLEMVRRRGVKEWQGEEGLRSGKGRRG